MALDIISTSMVGKDVIKLTGNGADFAVGKPTSISASNPCSLKFPLADLIELARIVAPM